MGMGPSANGSGWYSPQESASKFLSEFELVRVVGRGAFGKVMRCDAMPMGLLRVIDPAAPHRHLRWRLALTRVQCR